MVAADSQSGELEGHLLRWRALLVKRVRVVAPGVRGRRELLAWLLDNERLFEEQDPALGLLILGSATIGRLGHFCRIGAVAIHSCLVGSVALHSCLANGVALERVLVAGNALFVEVRERIPVFVGVGEFGKLVLSSLSCELSLSELSPRSTGFRKLVRYCSWRRS